MKLKNAESTRDRLVGSHRPTILSNLYRMTAWRARQESNLQPPA
jgi:hypothetical protein